MLDLDDLYSDMVDIKNEFNDDSIERNINNILSVLNDIKSDVLKLNKNNSEIGELLDEKD